MRRRSGCQSGACLEAEALAGRRMFAWSLVTDSEGRWGGTPCTCCRFSGCPGAGSAPAPGVVKQLASAGAAPEPAEPGQAGCADARAA